VKEPSEDIQSSQIKEEAISKTVSEDPAKQ